MKINVGLLWAVLLGGVGVTVCHCGVVWCHDKEAWSAISTTISSYFIERLL